MVRVTRVVTLVGLAAAMLSLTACERKITRIENVSQPLACADCHVANNLITGKETQWAESVHGTGEAYVRGTSASCAGCHSGNAFAERIEAGLDPDEVTSGDPDPTRQDCRACHMIHETYTGADFALKTTAPVTMYAVAGATFNGGEGNLCVNCHQPRRTIPAAVNGMITGISTHWGPHHGPQSSMLLGVAGAGVADMPGGHYAVPNTCVHCHMGEGLDHHFEPEVATCKKCHTDATNFNVNGRQAEIVDLIDQLGAQLVTRNLINVNGPDGHPIVTEAPEDEAIALWNWLYVAHEDKSNGAHNYKYAKALLEEGLARLAAPAPNPGPATLAASH